MQITGGSSPFRFMNSARQQQLDLFKNAQFIYELHLACLEVSALAPDAALGLDYRTFRMPPTADSMAIMKRSAYISHVDQRPTDYCRLTEHNIGRAFNQYVTHWFYPYKGKFHPQFVRALANILGLKPGDRLLDPFCGSGTTLLEGALLGLKTIGFDVSPLCVLISKMKANAVHHLHRIAPDMKRPCFVHDPPATYTPEIASTLSDPCESFELLARMIAKSDEARRGKDFEDRLARNREKIRYSLCLLRDAICEIGVSLPPARIEIADARRLPLDNCSVEGIITSPPYSVALNYVQNDAHALADLGYDLDRIKDEFIGVRGSGAKRFDLYERDMAQAYGEMARVLRPRGKACVILGNVTFQGREVDTVGNCIAQCERLGLCLLGKIDKIIYGLYNTMQREWILLFVKD